MKGSFFGAMICSGLISLPSAAAAQSNVTQQGRCNQANSGSGSNTLNCNFYVMPPGRSSAPRPSQPEPRTPVLRLSSPRCEAGQETTVKRPAPIVGDPGSGLTNGIRAMPGNALIVRFQLQDRCFFRYCIPDRSECFNGSVDVDALVDKEFLQKAKAVFEECKSYGNYSLIAKCMEAHGVRHPR